MSNHKLSELEKEMLEALGAAVECGMVPITSAKDGGAAALTRHAHVADMIRSVIAKAKGVQNEIR